MKNSCTKKTAMGLVLLFLYCHEAMAQKLEPKERSPLTFYGDLGAHVTPNGHGIFYHVALTAKKGRHSLTIGPSIQTQCQTIRGGRAAYAFALFGPGFKSILPDVNESDVYTPSYYHVKEEEYPFQLNTYVYGQYMNKLPLCRSYLQDEYYVNRIENYNWNEAKLSTLEFGIGFEFVLKLSNTIHWKNNISSAFVYHTNYITNMYHDRSFVTISIGSALEFGFK